MTVSLNSLSAKLVIFVSLEFFSGFFFLVPSFRVYSSVSSFCLTFCVCHYELDETAIPMLKRWLLYRLYAGWF